MGLENHVQLDKKGKLMFMLYVGTTIVILNVICYGINIVFEVKIELILNTYVDVRAI